jgi:hypothetical protein
MFDEGSYVRGSRAAWLAMLELCLHQLGIDDPEAGKVRWVSERARAILALRAICDNHGDNDWPDDLHLADAIEKHLGDHLERG